MNNPLMEKLFVEKLRSKETSAVTNSQAANANCENVAELFDGSVQSGWYRLMRKAYWAWLGQDPLETEALLSRIAMSKQQRTCEKLIDTVTGYQPGNWIYEWTQLGSQSYKAATSAQADGDLKTAKSLFLAASRQCVIASYPHLKGDRMAEQSQVLANSYYRAAGQLFSPTLKQIEVPFEKKTINGYLHLPFDHQPAPVVLVSGGVDNLQLEFYKLFSDYLAPNGLAMLTLDMPGMGNSSHWSISEDTSRLHQAVLHYLPNIPWVDEHRVGIMGSRMGGNVAVRLAYLEPKRIKAAVSIGGAVNSLFNDFDRFEQLPRMLKDSLASRIGCDAADSNRLFEQCQPFSLKRQGLLAGSKTPVPLLAIAAPDDLFCPPQDQQLLSAASYQGESIAITDSAVFDLYHKAQQKSAEWLTTHLG